MLFLYLNRHGFNGLCRYNKQGLYNVPFGCHRNSKNQPRSGYFPKKEMEMFLNIADRVTLIQGDFSNINQYIKSNSIVYFDPPYVDLIQENKEKIVSFNRYNANIFTLEDQKRLTDFAISLTQKHNALCCISNHDTIETRELYSIENFDIYSLSVLRSIAANSEKRRTVEELLAFTK